MVTKNSAIEIIQNYILQSKDEAKVDKCKDMLLKINSMSDLEFNRIVHNTFGDNSDLTVFNNWLMGKLEEPELQGTKFVKLNDFISYNLAGISKDTIALHVVPTHVNNMQIRNSGSYLVDALEQLKEKIKEGEFEKVQTIFAVSDILKLKMLQGYFRDLGFDVREGEEMFKRRFKNPYQASLSKDILLSEEWEKTKKEFMKDRPSIAELKSKEELEK